MSQISLPLWNRAFIFCVLNNLFLFIYYFALLAILPIYIVNDLGGSVKEAGLALTLFLVSSIAVRPFSGLIIEKFGKRLCMRGAGAIFALCAFAYLLIDSMWTLLAIRFLHGIWFSILTTVVVPVANDFIPEQRKGEGMGYFVMSTNLGVVFGPLVALTMIQFTSFKVLFGVLAVLVSIGLIFCWLIDIQQTPKTDQVLEKDVKTKLSLHDIIETKVIAVGMVALMTAFSYSSITSFITVFAETRHLLSYVSLFFIVFAVSMLLVRPWVGKFYDRKGPNTVIYPAFISFAIGLVIVTFSSNQWILWLSAIFIGVGYGSLFPCLQTLAIQSVNKQRMGHAISTFFTLFDLGLACGSVMMGIFIALWGFETTFIICSVIVMFTLLLYRQTVAKKRPNTVGLN